MDESSGHDLRIDDAALTAAVHRLAPLAGEIDAILAEVDAIVGDLRRDCSGHHTGAVLDSAQSASARVTEAELRAVRSAVVAFNDNLTRACAEFGDVDTATATVLGARQC